MLYLQVWTTRKAHCTTTLVFLCGASACAIALAQDLFHTPIGWLL